MLNFLIDFVVIATVYLFPVLVILLFGSPFIFMKLRKKRFSLLNILISLLVGTALTAGTLYAAYWGILLLGATAIYQLYGGQI